MNHGSKDFLGRHLLVDLADCDRALLDDVDRLRTAMLDSAGAIGATIVTDHFHRFAPQGVSGVIVIAESHLALHTWPEHGMASIDLFSCSEHLDFARLVAVVTEKFGASHCSTTTVMRGGFTDGIRISRPIEGQPAPRGKRSPPAAERSTSTR